MNIQTHFDKKNGAASTLSSHAEIEKLKKWSQEIGRSPETVDFFNLLMKS